LALLQDLTRALVDAVLAGDLARAQWLLAQRQAALRRLEQERSVEERLEQDLQGLREMERQLLEFCRTWRDIIQERLAGLAARQAVQRACCHTIPAPLLVDLKK
jgi:hypothetical protein